MSANPRKTFQQAYDEWTVATQGRRAPTPDEYFEHHVNGKPYPPGVTEEVLHLDEPRVRNVEECEDPNDPIDDDPLFDSLGTDTEEARAKGVREFIELESGRRVPRTLNTAAFVTSDEIEAMLGDPPAPPALQVAAIVDDPVGGADEPPRRRARPSSPPVLSTDPTLIIPEQNLQPRPAIEAENVERRAVDTNEALQAPLIPFVERVEALQWPDVPRREESDPWEILEHCWNVLLRKIRTKGARFQNEMRLAAFAVVASLRLTEVLRGRISFVSGVVLNYGALAGIPEQLRHAPHIGDVAYDRMLRLYFGLYGAFRGYEMTDQRITRRVQGANLMLEVDTNEALFEKDDGTKIPTMELLRANGDPTDLMVVFIYGFMLGSIIRELRSNARTSAVLSVLGVSGENNESFICRTVLTNFTQIIDSLSMWQDANKQITLAAFEQDMEVALPDVDEETRRIMTQVIFLMRHHFWDLKRRLTPIIDPVKYLEMNRPVDMSDAEFNALVAQITRTGRLRFVFSRLVPRLRAGEAYRPQFYPPVIAIEGNANFAWFLRKVSGATRRELGACDGGLHIPTPGNCLLKALACDCSGGNGMCVCGEYWLREQCAALKAKGCTCQFSNRMEIISTLEKYAEWERDFRGDRTTVVDIVFVSEFFQGAGKRRRVKMDWAFMNRWNPQTEHLRLIIVYLGIQNGKYESPEAHCAVLHLEPGYNANLVDLYNSLFSWMGCERETGICLPCGETMREREVRPHTIRFHPAATDCPRCGMHFRCGEDLVEHLTRYCPILDGGFRLRVLSNSVEKAKKKTGASVKPLIVYADTESTIDSASGEHKTCLVGGTVVTLDHQISGLFFVLTSIRDFIMHLCVNFPAPMYIVYFHNGEGYDFHFVLQALCQMEEVEDIDSVWETGQKVKFMSCTIRKSGRAFRFHFRDTYKFVTCSLDKWIEDCKKEEGMEWPIFDASYNALYRNAGEYGRELLLRKNPFPYLALNNVSCLRQTMSFFLRASLEEWGKGKTFTEEKRQDAIAHIREVFRTFGITTVEQYLTLYLMCDVCLLADCMENFGNRVQEELSLNVHDFLGSPALSWNCWLGRNEYRMEPIVDGKMYDLVKACIRGGQVQASQRLYDRDREPGTLALDLDCNNLYGTAMLRYDFPVHSWRYLDKPSIESIKRLEEEGYSGFALVDLVLPDRPDAPYLDWPFIAESVSLPPQFFYGKHYEKFFGGHPPGHGFSGLMQHVGHFRHYSCSTKNLLWYLEHGAYLENLYYAYVGKCVPIFTRYVSDNMAKRVQHRNNPTLKMLYKLLTNSLYGKTYEDVERRSKVVAYNEISSAGNAPELQLREVYSEKGWHFVETEAEEVVLDKPIFLGACITEWSKLWMYKFYYDEILAKHPELEPHIMYTDTDAITIKFKWDKSLRELINLLNKDEQWIDTSNFADQNGFVHTEKNGLPGLFKSETTAPIHRMVALRAKSYIMECDDGSIKMSLKGVPFNAREGLDFDAFADIVLHPGKNKKVEFDTISSKDQKVTSETKGKIALSGDDLKRLIDDDLIHTRPHNFL